MKTEVICETCGGQKEMYYAPWCSKCDIPEPQILTELNLLQCMRHIERAHFGIEDETDMVARRMIGRDEIWDGLCEWGLHNDSTMSFPIVAASQGDGSLGELSEEAIEYLEAMVNVFDLTDQHNMMWEVSW